MNNEIPILTASNSIMLNLIINLKPFGEPFEEDRIHEP